MRITFVLAAFCFGCVLSNAADAQEGFFSRWNPMQLFRSEASSSASKQQLQEIRTRLEARGVPQDVLDQRVSRPETPRMSDDALSGSERVEIQRVEMAPGGGQVSVNGLRDKMLSRGIDVDSIDARIGRIAEQRQGQSENPHPFTQLRLSPSTVLSSDAPLGTTDHEVIKSGQLHQSEIRIPGVARRNR